MSELIKRPAHVALRVPDLEASVAWATTVMGMRETRRDGGTSYLTHGDCHHSLMYIASDRSELDHIALEAHDEQALEALTAKLAAADVALIADAPQEHGLSRAIRFATPGGHVVEVFTGMQEAGPWHTGRGIQPRKFSHPMLTAEDTAPTVAFLIDVLGFRLSDDVGEGTLVFTRCNPDHHGVGVGRGPRSGLNHYAFEVASLAAIGELGDVLDRNGGRFIWGPGRHGAGSNIYSYHFDPAGAIVEYCAEMYRVWDEAAYEPGHWTLDDPRFANIWGPGPPIEMMETATPQA